MQKLYSAIRSAKGAGRFYKNLDMSKFRDGLDLNMIIRKMYPASEGYLWELTQKGESADPEKIRRDFTKMIEFWKAVFYK